MCLRARAQTVRFLVHLLCYDGIRGKGLDKEMEVKL